MKIFTIAIFIVLSTCFLSSHAIYSVSDKQNHQSLGFQWDYTDNSKSHPYPYPYPYPSGNCCNHRQSNQCKAYSNPMGSSYELSFQMTTDQQIIHVCANTQWAVTHVAITKMDCHGNPYDHSCNVICNINFDDTVTCSYMGIDQEENNSLVEITMFVQCGQPHYELTLCNQSTPVIISNGTQPSRGLNGINGIQGPPGPPGPPGLKGDKGDDGETCIPTITNQGKKEKVYIEQVDSYRYFTVDCQPNAIYEIIVTDFDCPVPGCKVRCFPNPINLDGIDCWVETSNGQPSIADNVIVVIGCGENYLDHIVDYCGEESVTISDGRDAPKGATGASGTSGGSVIIDSFTEYCFAYSTDISGLSLQFAKLTQSQFNERIRNGNAYAILFSGLGVTGIPAAVLKMGCRCPQGYVMLSSTSYVLDGIAYWTPLQPDIFNADFISLGVTPLGCNTRFSDDNIVDCYFGQQTIIPGSLAFPVMSVTCMPDTLPVTSSLTFNESQVEMISMI